MTSQSYLRTFLILFCLASVVTFILSRADLFPWIGACNGQGYDDDHYLAYCENTRYGDYEYGAFLYDLEPEAVVNLKKAETLFLGNSRSQYTFSSQPVVDTMDASGTPWYAMGFGFDGRSPLVEALFELYALNPRLLVINADPFFDPVLSPLSNKVLNGGKSAITEYKKKRWLQGLHQRLCAQFGDGLLAPLLCGNTPTLFRSRTNGTWIVEHYRPDRRIPVTYSDVLMDSLDSTVEAANSFLANLGVPRDCVVLTILPRKDTPLEFGQALAERLDLAFASPQLDSLSTIDASHMDIESNIRWANAFLDDIRPVMDRCLEL